MRLGLAVQLGGHGLVELGGGRQIGLVGSRCARVGIGRYRKEDLALVAGLVDAGAYRPVIDRIYAIDEVVEATRYVESGQKTGNVVLRIVEAVTAPSPASGLSATAGDRPAAREACS